MLSICEGDQKHIMDDKFLPQSVGDNSSAPSPLTPKQEELCKRLDGLHAQYGLKAKPSEMFRGAIFASRVEFRTNPDWIAQAGNSLRGILYPFSNDGVPNKEKALQEYGSVRIDAKYSDELGKILGEVSLLAHHGNARGKIIDFISYTPEDFEKLLSRFERIMFEVLDRQVDIHHEVDEILALDIEESSTSF